MDKKNIETFFLIGAFVGITLILVYSEYRLKLVIMLLNFILIIFFAWVCYVVGRKQGGVKDDKHNIIYCV